MDFYTLAYVQSQASTRELWALIVFAAILLALLVVGIQVLRNGFTSRYRQQRFASARAYQCEQPFERGY